MTDDIQHPGAYVRNNIIPAGMNVSEASKLLEIGRPALSNFLNGKSNLSTDMAARLEIAFGVPARKLLDMQTAWDALNSKRPAFAPIVKAYIPPFLQIKASIIEEWAGAGLTPRARLSVFLRTLVNSTGQRLTKVDFPGNDDSERAGWDGLIEASEGTPWIPDGLSGWEFGVNQEPKKKADGDYQKSLGAVKQADRKNITFVFVTPRSWKGKLDWVREKKAEKQWKDVRAYDASDLEQWLEQSIAGQVWFANETNQSAFGAESLDEAQKIWAADCEPVLKPSLFADAVDSHRNIIKLGLASESHTPTIISADSYDEGLAFLSSSFASSDEDFGIFRDRIIIFRKPGILSKLASQVSNFIPVILSREVEKEFAPYRAAMPSFIIYPRNAAANDPDIVLETLNYDAFNKALEDMGIDRDRIAQLSLETGHSPTILRRRLSLLSAVKTPDWATDRNLARTLVPFLFAGTWRTNKNADREIISKLCGDNPFDEIEDNHNQLLMLDSAPVWSAGFFRGVVSKIDILFAIKDVILESDLKRFFEIAAIVLGEEDPALELEEDKRWAASLYNKSREYSGELRDGIAETLVMLAVYGNSLFLSRTGFNSEVHADRLVHNLLDPITAGKLESQARDLPLYSEASPEVFLSLLEGDLDSSDPETLKLMRPSGSSLFSTSPRTGLLWALENLAWSKPHFMRTVLVLGRLAERVIDDNLMNKPSNTLACIFRSWMPQTSASLEERKKAITMLAKKLPLVAWPICVDQFSSHSRVGHYNHKPRWRPDNHGYGNTLTYNEINQFALHCFELALTWPAHSLETVESLVSNLQALEEDLKLRVWDLVDRWSENATKEERASLREKIRVSCLSRRAVLRRKSRKKVGSDERARRAFNNLEADDPIFRHQWLFRQAWVDESAYEVDEIELDWQKREEQIGALRDTAAKEVYDYGGVEALLKLAESGQAHHIVGWCMAKALAENEVLETGLLELILGGPLVGVRSGVLVGALGQACERQPEILEKVVHGLSKEVAGLVLRYSPFNRKTWDLLDILGNDFTKEYWSEINPGWNSDLSEIEYAIDCLVAVSRPRAAFSLARFKMKELSPRRLFNLLRSVAIESSEVANSYMLDRHYLLDAFNLLNLSGEFTVDEMAELEFFYIDVFDSHGQESRMLNLEKKIAMNPEFFVQAVAFLYKRDDGKEDPPETLTLDKEQRSHRANACYKLLSNIQIIPGADQNGNLTTNGLVAWIEGVREQCAALCRTTMGDQTIGQMMAYAPAGDDGVWPCKPVRDALEDVMTDHIGKGLKVALFNSRGVHSRGEGGWQERELAARYGGWAKAMDYTHPRLATILREMEKDYLQDANREDLEAKVSRRMRH